MRSSQLAKDLAAKDDENVRLRCEVEHIKESAAEEGRAAAAARVELAATRAELEALKAEDSGLSASLGNGREVFTRRGDRISSAFMASLSKV